MIKIPFILQVENFTTSIVKMQELYKRVVLETGKKSVLYLYELSTVFDSRRSEFCRVEFWTRLRWFQDVLIKEMITVSFKECGRFSFAGVTVELQRENQVLFCFFLCIVIQLSRSNLLLVFFSSSQCHDQF